MSQQRNWKRILIGSAAGLALAGGITAAATMAPSVVSAQTDEVSGSNLSEIRMQGPQAAVGLGRMESREELDIDAALAQALGISEDELAEAKEAALAAGLAQAVEQGLITQEQADEITENGGLGRMGEGFGRGMGRAADDIDPQALLAEALGITADELEAATGEAQQIAIDNALEEGLITEAQANEMTVQHMVREALRDAHESAPQAAVEAGLITQAQADQMTRQGAHGPGGFDGGQGRDGRHHGGPGRDGGEGRGDGRGGPGERGPRNSDQSGATPSQFLPDLPANNL